MATQAPLRSSLKLSATIHIAACAVLPVLFVCIKLNVYFIQRYSKLPYILAGSLSSSEINTLHCKCYKARVRLKISTEQFDLSELLMSVQF